MPGQGFLDTIVKLVQLGGLGIGALIFLFVFLILMKGGTVDAPTAELRKRFLSYGVIFAVLALATSLAQLWMAPQPGPTPSELRLITTFAHDFGASGLPAPQMKILETGAAVEPDQPVRLAADATLSIRIDPLINAAKALPQARETAANLAVTNAELTEQLQAAARAPATTAPPPAAAPEIRAAQVAVSESIARQDWVAASRASANLRAWIEAPVVAQPER